MPMTLASAGRPMLNSKVSSSIVMEFATHHAATTRKPAFGQIHMFETKTRPMKMSKAVMFVQVDVMSAGFLLLYEAVKKQVRKP